MADNQELVQAVEGVLEKNNIKPLSFISRIFNSKTFSKDSFFAFIKEINILTAKVKELNLKNDKAESKIYELENEFAVANTTFKERVTNLENDKKELSDKVEYWNKSYEAKSSEAALLSADVLSLNLDLQSKINSLKSEHQNEINKISKDSADLILKNDSKKQKIIDELNSKIEFLTNRLAESNSDIEEITKENESVSEELKDVVETVEKLAEKVNIKGAKSLSDDNVREMRRLYDTGELTSFKKLGIKFGISASGASRVCKRETYTNVI